MGIGNHPVYTLGEITLEFLVAGNILKHKFHIVANSFPINADGVIGNDFLTLNNAILNYKSNKLVINSKPVDMKCLKNFNGNKNIIQIPPRTEMVIPLQVVSKLKEGIIESKTIVDGLYCPSAIVKADQNNKCYTHGRSQP